MNTEGYSVQRLTFGTWRVVKDGCAVGLISRLRVSGAAAWDWHDKSMWGFRANDFVRV